MIHCAPICARAHSAGCGVRASSIRTASASTQAACFSRTRATPRSAASARSIVRSSSTIFPRCSATLPCRRAAARFYSRPNIPARSSAPPTGSKFVPPSSLVPEDVARAAERLAPAPVTAIEQVGTGGNSRVFKVVTAAGPYALKIYPADDRRDRQGAEARALAFVARAKLGRTPRLLAADESAYASLLSWIDGT